MSSQRAAQELQKTAEYLHAKAARRSGEAASALRQAVEMVAARKPLTVADIPAGQGPASLFIGRASDGCPVLTFKDEDGDMIVIEHGNPPTPSGRAFWDHLAATLPHVTDEEDR